ncbi:MAG: HutD family protein [Pseudomonadota bacterium]|nr:HutD family protein [Pseudomonadota bacterium]
MIIRLADCPPQPWKNGLGRTRELAVHPVAAGGADFVWRVSIAEVDSAAPFSRFPGIDRQIVLLDGAGFTMRLDDGQVHALTTPLAPFAFAGERGVEIALAGGATQDFNLMLRRGRAHGRVLPWLTAGERRLDKSTVLVYCARGTIATGEGPLHAGDAWRPAPADGLLELHHGAAALAVQVDIPAG